MVTAGLGRTCPLVVLAALATLIVVCAPGPFGGRDVVCSPHGRIPDGAKAYSNDGRYYVCEVAPYEEGHVGVYEVSGNREVRRWDILDGTKNDIKGLAWSRDSRRFAVMYHGGVKPGVRAFDVGEQEEVAAAAISKWYHYMAFTKDQDAVLVSTDGNGREEVRLVPPPSRGPAGSLPATGSPPPEGAVASRYENRLQRFGMTDWFGTGRMELALQMEATDSCLLLVVDDFPYRHPNEYMIAYEGTIYSKLIGDPKFSVTARPRDPDYGQKKEYLILRPLSRALTAELPAGMSSLVRSYYDLFADKTEN